MVKIIPYKNLPDKITRPCLRVVVHSMSHERGLMLVTCMLDFSEVQITNPTMARQTINKSSCFSYIKPHEKSQLSPSQFHEHNYGSWNHLWLSITSFLDVPQNLIYWKCTLRTHEPNHSFKYDS